MASSTTFKCPACGHGYFMVVSIRREGKPDYETEFVACAECKVMIWSPGSMPKKLTPLLSTWGAARKRESNE